MLKVFSIVALALVMYTLTACSTVEGAGQDLKDASNATRDAFKD